MSNGMTAAEWLRVREDFLHVEMVQLADKSYAIVLVLDEGYTGYPEIPFDILDSHREDFESVVKHEGLQLDPVSKALGKRYWKVTEDKGS